MYFTGFADEAASDIDGQINATKELGWGHIEARSVNGVNINDLTDDQFEIVYGKLQDSGIKVNCIGSTIANWARSVEEPFDKTVEDARRAVRRMQKLDTKLIRIMSYAVLEHREPDDQMEKERFRRLRGLRKIFADAGLCAVHENCMNYGGMGWQYTLKLIENVSGLKLVFDTGNPVFLADRSKPKPYPRQSSWEFYSHVKEHIAYVHIKDCIWHQKNDTTYTYPGEGNADVKRILADMLVHGYDGGISIEPHLSVVFHDKSVRSDNGDRYRSYIEYGRRLMMLADDMRGVAE